MNNPEYVKINDIKLKINTDYRIALKCDEISKDITISDYERSLAIIYLLFGEEGLKLKENYERLLELAIIYLSCSQEKENNNDEPDMDFQQDMELIRISFMSEYGFDLKNKELHWWDFYNMINGLSNSEMGNCCILNRVRNLRTYDTSKIQDKKEKKKIDEAKKHWSLKKKKIVLTTEQQKSVDSFYQLTGIERK